MNVKVYGKFRGGLLVAIAVTFPFVNLFHILYPVNIFGKSAWIVLPVIALALLYLTLLGCKKSRLSTDDLIFAIITITCWLIYLIRELVYAEGRSFLDYRYIPTSLIFILLIRHLMKDPSIMRILAYAIFIQGFLVAATRSINYYFSPHLMVSNDAVDGAKTEVYINTSGELTRDLLLGSSISANHIVCGMFIFITLKRLNILNIPFALFIAVQGMMMVSIFNTGSRFPITVAIVLFGLSVFYASAIGIKTVFNLVMAGMMVFAIFYAFDNETFQFLERYGEGSGGRYEKMQLIFLFITNSATDFLIGSSSYLVNSTTINNITLSDNSYGLILTSFGVPFGLAFVAFLFNILTRTRSDGFSILFLIYIILGLGVTNSILWEPWVFTAFFGFGVSSYYGATSVHKHAFNRRLRAK